MRLITHTFLCCLIIGVSACTVEPAGDTVSKSFNASTVSVKSALADDGHTVVWSKDDRINLFDGTSNNCFSIVESSIKGSEASFKGEVAKGSIRFIAVYPYSEDVEFVGQTFFADLPAEQAPVAGGFDPSCAMAVAITETETLAFQNLVSLFKVTLGPEHSDVKKIHVYGNNGEKICGDFNVEMDLSGSVKSISEGSENDICVQGNLAAGESYYLASLGDVTFSNGFSVFLLFKDGRSAVKVVPDRIELPAGSMVSIDMAGVQKEALMGGVVTLGKGASTAYILNNLSNISLTSSVPSGWKVSVSDGNRVDIKAPSTDAGVDLYGQVTFSCTPLDGEPYESPLMLRVRGINSLQDFKSFREACQAGTSPNGYPPVNDYLVDNKVVLNTDIEIGPSDMIPDGTCFMYSLTYPLEGNGKTITINNSNSGKGMNSLFGYLRANVSDLTLKGKLSAANTLCHMAPLAAYCGNYPTVTKTITIKNVKSYVDVSYTNSSSTSSQIAGLVAVCTGTAGTFKFENCEVFGKITTSQSILDTGGFIGRGESGSPGVIVTFTDCTFSGEIVYSQTAIHSNPRVGGFVASGERQTNYTRCTNNGKITANLNNTVFDPDGGGGLGGILGRSSKVTSGYNMGWYLNTVTTNCEITINGQPSGATTAYFGKIIGSKQDEAQQYVSVTEGGSITINNY